MIRKGKYYAKFTCIHDSVYANEDVRAADGKLVELINWEHRHMFPVLVRYRLSTFQVKRDELNLSDEQFNGWLTTQKLLGRCQ